MDLKITRVLPISFFFTCSLNELVMIWDMAQLTWQFIVVKVACCESKILLWIFQRRVNISYLQLLQFIKCMNACNLCSEENACNISLMKKQILC
jgi:hypothetical protein